MKILVVEDEAVVAIDLGIQIEDLGAEVVGPAHNLSDALVLAENGQIDIALLDINLRGEPSLPVANLLRLRGVPFIFLTGYENAPVCEEFDDVPIVPKPISTQQLANAIRLIADWPK